jgi:acyl-CoA thioesterase
MRFRPRATYDEAAVDACRLLLAGDSMEWPAATRAHRSPIEFIAPTAQLTARFHRLDPASEWLLCETTAPVAADGMIGSGATIWSESGNLLATTVQQMLCRPVPAVS